MIARADLGCVGETFVLGVSSRLPTPGDDGAVVRLGGGAGRIRYRPGPPPPFWAKVRSNKDLGLYPRCSYNPSNLGDVPRRHRGLQRSGVIPQHLDGSRAKTLG
jgi:hypothetical protein